ncbi:MAG: hypothetical protein KA797_03385 [Chitinophagales bacterium]|nr:hypothetical protein [Chitinophagales bacterium]
MICLAIEKLKGKLPPPQNEFRLPKSFDAKFNKRILMISVLAMGIFLIQFDSIKSRIALMPEGKFIQDYPWALGLGFAAALTWIGLYLYNRRKKRTENYRLIFSDDSIIERKYRGRDKIIAYNQVKSIDINAIGEIRIVGEQVMQRIYVSRFIERYADLLDRFATIMPIKKI